MFEKKGGLCNANKNKKNDTYGNDGGPGLCGYVA